MRKSMKKLFVTAAMLGVLALTAAGCSSIKGTETVAVFEGENISMDWVNLFARFQQAEMETSYSEYYGEDMWSLDLYGTGSTYESIIKANIVESAEKMLIMEKYAPEYGVEITSEEEQQIVDAATAFLAANDEKTLQGMTATQESVERMLTLYTISMKMEEAMVADVDPEVSDEEAAQKAISYVFFSTLDYTNDDGETVERTDEEKEEIKANAEQVLEVAQVSGDLEAAVEALEDDSLYVSEATYGEENGSIVDALREAADLLSEGEYAPLVETDNGYYVLVLDSEFDEEATEAQKETIVTERKQEAYNALYEEWQEACDFSVKERAWSKVSFISDSFTVYTGEEETEAETQDNEDDAEPDDADADQDEEETEAQDE